MSKNPPQVDTTRAVLKEDVTSLADKLKKLIKIDHKTGSADVEEGAYVKHLPEGLTADTIKHVQSYNSLFSAAGALAVGECSIAAGKKNKEIDRITVDIPTVGKDKFTFVFDREKQVPNRVADGQGGTKMDGSKTVYGNISVSLDIYGTRNRGELKKIKELLGAEATAAFSK
jgi:hypothetical protein